MERTKMMNPGWVVYPLFEIKGNKFYTVLLDSDKDEYIVEFFDILDGRYLPHKGMLLEVEYQNMEKFIKDNKNSSDDRIVKVCEEYNYILTLDIVKTYRKVAKLVKYSKEDFNKLFTYKLDEYVKYRNEINIT